MAATRGVEVGTGVLVARIVTPGMAVATGADVAIGACVAAAGACVAEGGDVAVADDPQATAIIRSNAPNNGKTVLRLIIGRFNISAPMCSVERFSERSSPFAPKAT